MKKSISLILFITLISFLLINCKKQDDTPVSPAKIIYTVDYNLHLTGDYLDLMIQYYDAHDVLKTVNNPALPWDLTLEDFESGDTVLLNISYAVPPAQGSVSWGYEWAIKATGGGDTPIDMSYSNGGTGTIQDTMPINIEWSTAI